MGGLRGPIGHRADVVLHDDVSACARLYVYYSDDMTSRNHVMYSVMNLSRLTRVNLIYLSYHRYYIRHRSSSINVSHY